VLDNIFVRLCSDLISGVSHSVFTILVGNFLILSFSLDGGCSSYGPSSEVSCSVFSVLVY
jgi:hypothetical protein